ncbi:hypothetical protein [Micromonospora sp. 4G55]|uniref:hypothetical protein n=1 Tax=Micromonospora sp. 4G55 TaxID=2806102 RepID=UPI001A5C623F|nr:hypothetical protein [Micromonospora sp. 4G55]MBM0260223.1 hypothetical protein [Micromonospora sp. 4G55]
MADQNVPPRGPWEDRGWTPGQHPTPDGYRDVHRSTPYAVQYQGQVDPGQPHAGYATQPAPRGPQWVGPEGLPAVVPPAGRHRTAPTGRR